MPPTVIYSDESGFFDVGGTWAGGVAPVPATESAYVNNTHVVTLRTSISLGSGDNTVTIAAGGSMPFTNGAGALSLASGGASYLDVYGDLGLSGILSSSTGGIITIRSGGELAVAADATWSVAAGSTMAIEGTLDVDKAVTLAGTISGAAGIIEASADLAIDAAADFSDFEGTLELDPAGAIDLTTNGATLPAVDTTGGTVTLIDGLACAGWAISGGTFDPNGKDIVVTGDLTYSAGTVTQTGTWRQTGTGLEITWASAGNALKSYTLSAGSTSERQDTLSVEKAVIEAGATLSAVDSGDILSIYRPAGNDFFSCAGTISVGTVRIYPVASRSNSYSIDCGVLLDYQSGNNRVWTQTGPLAAADLIIRDANAGAVGTIDCEDTLDVGGGIELGYDLGGDKSGKLILHGQRVTVGAGGIAGAHAENLANEIDFGSAAVICAGTIDGDLIATLSHTAAAIHRATVQNCDMSGGSPLYLYNGTVGAGNTNVFGQRPHVQGPAARVGCGL